MIKTFTKIIAETKFASLAFLSIVSLQFLQIAEVSAQVQSQQRLASELKISKVEAINESRSGLIDGKIVVTIEDLIAQPSTYRLSYDLHAIGNNFISPVLKNVNNVLTLSNAKLGNYYNLKVIRTADNITSSAASLFKVENASYTATNGVTSNRTSTICTNTINYNDCNGASKSISNCRTGSGYNDNNNYRPCGLEVAPNCSVFSLKQWHCIDGNLSAPPNHNEYTPTDFLGAGLTALQASRINWIVCNYNCFTDGVDNAIWYIAGTGGSNNAIAQAAAAAVPVANGTQSLMTFYKSLNGSYQDMVQWQCRSLLTNASIGNFVWVDNNLNGIQDAGEPGLFDVTVTLKNAAGTIIDVTNTSSTGAYSFFGLSAGSYTVTFTTPAGYSVSPANVTTVGATDANDSDPLSGVVNVTLSTSTEINNSIDAGFYLTPIVPVSLGNLVFDDKNRSGLYDAGDAVIVGATVRLYVDANNDNVPDGVAISTTTTNANGNYSFTNLAGGNYIVGVVLPSLFAPAVLGSSDPDNNINNDNNGITLANGEVRGNSIILASGTEPDVNTNNTYDFGLYNPSLPPNGGEGCFTGTNPAVFAKSYWNVNANSQTVTMRVTFSKTFVDNTYGTSAIGWPGGHTFSNLTGSDHLLWSIKNGAGAEVLAFKQDYISAGAAFPSGYGTLGFGGDGGTPTAGLATDVLSFRSSIASNLNDYGYVLTTNSPTTDANYTPNAATPNWIYEVWYEITVKASAFGASGFGFIDVASVHASPSKTGNNTEAVTNTPCPVVNLGNVVWYDLNNDGIKQSTEVGIAGVTVKLYKDLNNDNVVDGAATATTITDANGAYNFVGLDAGNYIVGVMIPTGGYVPATSTGADPDNNIDNDNSIASTVGTEVRGLTISLSGGAEPDGTGATNTNTNNTYDFGFFAPDLVSIGDFVWNDANGNGLQDAGEQGLSGVQIQLKNAAGSVIATTTSNANGFYQFIGLAAGTYTVQFLSVAGFGVSPANVGTNDAIDSDVNATGSVTVTLTTGQSNQTIDAGFCPTTLCIGNLVWNDLNNNGLREATEVGINAATVNIYQDANNDNVVDGPAFATTTTSTTGIYSFCNLTPGNYIIGVVTPTGFATSAVNSGDPDDNIDNDNNGVNAVGTEVRGLSVTISGGAEPNGTGATNTDTNNSYDIGFYFIPVPVTLGNKVFDDKNRSGIFDAGDGIIAGATVRLYLDANNDNVPDGAALSTTITDANGNYSFINLNPGNYIVGVVPPASFTIAVLNGGDPDNDIDNDNNGISLVTGEVRGSSITLLSGSEPELNANNTYDFGLYNPSLPPNGGEGCFTGTNPAVFAKSFWNVNANSQTVTMRVTFAKTFVDNTYGTNAIGWPGGHTFSNLTGSDHLQWSVKNGAGAEVLAFKQDYISAGAAFPSGYGNLGFGGDGGTPTVGLATDVLSFRSSMASNFNDYGYVLTTNSPATNANYTPNAATPNWIYEVWYEITVKASAFGASGFGFIDVASVHASPSKTGNNTEAVTNTPCPVVNLGNVVWNDINSDGIKQSTEAGIAGVSVKLYVDANNDNAADGVPTATTITDANGVYNFANLTAGNYIVGVTIPTGFTVGTINPADPDNNIDNDNNGANTSVVGEIRSNAITLSVGSEPAATEDGDGTAGNLTLDFSLKGTASIGDFVFNDINANGVQDAGELGIAGITVALTYPNGSITTVLSDANGNYNFTGLVPGTYNVTFLTPAGYRATTPNAGTNDAIDSDPVNGVVSGIILTAGQVITSVDAGFFQVVNVGNTVWFDQNNDGIKQSNESGIAGVTVKLYADLNNDNIADGAALATLTTNANGIYNFTNLIPGDYIVGVNIPNGYAVVTTNGGDPDNNIDNDNNGLNTTIVGEVRSSTVSLTSSLEPAIGVDGDGNNGNLTVDFGFRGTASISDFVFNDANGNGIQDAGELGIAGATVILTNPNGTTSTVITNQNGNYSFDNLAPGSYNVTFNTPAGFTPTTSNVGANDGLDSDPINGIVSVVLAAGQINNTVDAGFYELVSLGNTVWYDQNNDGIKQPTEQGISAVTVNLYADANNDNLADGAVISTTITDANGLYNFTNLAPGTYIVAAVIPSGYAAVTTVTGGDPDNDIDNDNNGTNPFIAGQVRSFGITLLAGTEPSSDGDGTNGNLTVDFALRGTGFIGDFVFNDTNGNGIQDPGEEGIAGATVVLTYPNGTTVTTTTDANGNYTFANLAPGTGYSLQFTTPSGLAASPSNIGSNDNLDSDPINGVVSGITVTAGQVNTSVDAGFFAANVMNLGNVVWYDQNNNGIKDPAETGIVGATVNLYTDANGDNLADGASIATVVTNATGTYNFSGLLPGNYIVGVNIPLGYTVGATNGNDPDDNIDNDNNGTNTLVAGEVRSSAITLSLTTEPTTDGDGSNGNLTLDFGFKGTASISDFVFNDTNGNGIQDAGEVGIAGVTVSLLNPNGTTTTTVTDANGNYSFPNLAPGSYNVTFTTPNGLTASPSNVGLSDATDSDPVGGTVLGVILTAGQINNTVDAGFFAANVMNIGNLVWYDQNNNGIKDATENGIAGATVKLYIDANDDNSADGASISTTTTDANGVYNFGGLTAGNYIVGVNIPTGYAVVSTNGGDPDNNTDNDNNGTNTSIAGEVRSATITLALTTEPATDGDPNNGNLTLDFGFKGTASISDFVFNDANGNGIQDAGEVGIPNVTVSLLNPNGTTTTTTTDANGNYSFPNLAPGSYNVTFTTPSGLSASPSNQGTNDAIDSDPIGGTVTGVILNAGQINNTVDAGFFAANVMNIGNQVWYDQNNNGIKDATENGIAGATVKLYIDANDDNSADGASIGTTTTDANGVYNFGGLSAGNYIVGVNIPTGYVVVTTNGGDPDNNTDNDNNGINTSVAGEVRSNTIALALTTEPTTDGDGNNGNLTVDFGFRGTGLIGNFVFNDVNANGIQDVTEVGLAGVTVTLTNPNGTITTTTTDNNGLYSFTNLAPGTYSVTFTTPPAYNVSPANVTVNGATDANDSDPVSGIVSNILLAAGELNTSIDAGFFNCLPLNSGINGQTQICANETAVFNATGAGAGSVYAWTFNNGNPATATGVNASSTWSIPGEYDITLTVTKNGCTSTYERSIVITQAIFANAGPDADICSGTSTTLVGSGPAGALYSWIVISGDPTSIDNGTNQSSVLVSPNITTTYQLTVSQNGCTKIDQVTVFINVSKNPVADAGLNKTVLLGSSVVIGGSPTGTAPIATPGSSLAYIWSPATGISVNGTTNPNPTVTPTAVGTTEYRVIVYASPFGCSDTALVKVTAVQPVNVGNSVWFDKNNNGINDAGDSPLVTVVNLYKDDNADNVPDGAAIATTTSTGGVYNFGSLFPGNYIVGAVIPNGYAPAATTANSAIPNSDIDNDNNGTVNTSPTEIRTNTIELTANGEPVTASDGDDNNGNRTIDFGFRGTANIGDFVWYDNNRNGIQEVGELGIPNVKVTLTYPDGSTLDATTNNNGAYNFPNLMPGSYNVGFTTPIGFVATVSNSTAVGATDNNDSDPIAGAVNGLVLAAGEINTSVDAGFHNACSGTLKGNVWHDVDALNDNLVDSTGAYLVASIPVGLRVYMISSSTGKVVKATTVLSNGSYTFFGVTPDNYVAILTLNAANVGDNAPANVLPNRWINTGEKLGLTPGSDPLTNGRVNITFAYECVINLNFGIKFLNKDGGID